MHELKEQIPPEKKADPVSEEEILHTGSSSFKTKWKKLFNLFYPGEKNSKPVFPDNHPEVTARPVDTFDDDDTLGIDDTTDAVDTRDTDYLDQYFQKFYRKRIEYFLSEIYKSNHSENELSDSSHLYQESIEELWTSGLWYQVIERLSSSPPEVVSSYITKIRAEMAGNDSFLLSKSTQIKLVELLIKINSSESNQLLEETLLWIHLTSDILLTPSDLFSAALYSLVVEHKKKGDSVDDWLNNFFYTYLYLHPSAFETYSLSATPLSCTTKRKEVARYIVGRLVQDAGVFTAGVQNDEESQKSINIFLDKIVEDLAYKPAIFLKLQDNIRGIFRRNKDVDVKHLALILAAIDEKLYDSEYIDDCIAFTISQFDSVDDITIESLQKKEMFLKSSLYVKHLKIMDTLTSGSTDYESIGDIATILKDTSFSSNAGLLYRDGKNPDIFDNFLLVYSMLDDDLKDSELREFLVQLFKKTSINILILLDNQHIDEEVLKEIVSFAVRVPLICERFGIGDVQLAVFLNKHTESKDPLSLLTNIDFLASDETAATLESWRNDPRISASGIDSNLIILEAIYNYWSVQDVIEINDALSLAYGLPEDTAVWWGDFYFRKKIPKADLLAIEDIATGDDLLEIKQLLREFASEKKYNVEALINGLLGYREFISHIKKCELENLSAIRSVDLISFVEPKWFSIIIEALQEKLSAKEGFVDLSGAIEGLIEGYEKTRQIDGQDGLWKHRIVLHRDGSMVEDHEISITLKIDQGKPQLSIEFKLTRPTINSVTPKLTTISEYKRWRIDENEEALKSLSTQEQRINKLRLALEKIAEYCQSCEVYHLKKTNGNNVIASHLEELGFTEQEYEKLLKTLKGPSLSKMKAGIWYPSTPTAINKYGSTDYKAVNATAEFQPDPDILVATVGSESDIRGYHGSVVINIHVDPTHESRQLALNTFGVAVMMGLDGVFSPVDQSSQRKLALNRFLWHRKIEPDQAEQINETVDRLQWQEVASDHCTFVEPGFHEQLEQEGLKYLYSTMNTVSGVVGAFDVGLLSGNHRRKLGINRGGWSADRDITSGGSDYAFVRAATDSPNCELGLYAKDFVMVWDTELLDRTDWFAYEYDQYGSTEDERLSVRPDPVKFIRNQRKEPSTSNEVCLKKAVTARHLVFVVTRTKGERDELIQQLKDKGITHHRGVSIEECVIVSPKKSNGKEWPPEVKDFISNRYQIMMSKYRARSRPEDKRHNNPKLKRKVI